MKKIFFAAFTTVLCLPLTALALDYGLGTAADGTNLTPVSAEVLAANVIRIILGFVGIIFLLLVIYAGFLWMVGGRDGNEEAISKAKSLLTNATIGLLVIVAAYSITYYITLYLLQATQPTVQPPAQTAPTTGS
jgi:heme/copper-type cytochrome/quinol oxidase subunit 2